MANGDNNDNALNPVARGVRLMGSDGNSCPKAAYVSATIFRPGNCAHRAVGRGMSCSRGIRAMPQQKATGQKLLRRPFLRRPNSDSNNSGIAHSWRTASPRNPFLVPPPNRRLAATTRPVKKTCRLTPVTGQGKLLARIARPPFLLRARRN